MGKQFFLDFRIDGLPGLRTTVWYSSSSKWNETCSVQSDVSLVDYKRRLTCVITTALAHMKVIASTVYLFQREYSKSIHSKHGTQPRGHHLGINQNLHLAKLGAAESWLSTANS